MEYVLFTDNLADLSIHNALRAAKSAGFDGIDLTLRPGGHVKPEQADLGLAEAHAAAAQLELSIPMASTAITDTSSPHAEDVIAACAHHGIRRIKLGYWHYQPFGNLRKQLDETRLKLKRIIALARRYAVLPCVHVHSGPIMANGGSSLYLILQDFSPDDVGAYVDPMHMSVEGGLSGWEMGLDLLAPWLALVGMKNYRWQPQERDQHGQLQYRWQFTPLADGQAPLPQFIARLKQLHYNGTMSLHSEYKGGSSFRQLSTEELLTQSAADLTYIRQLVKAV